MRKIFIPIFAYLVIFLPFGGCATDVTAALVATQQMEDIAIGAFDSFEEVIKNAQGLDPAKKDEILSLAKEERDKFMTILSELRGFITAYGSIEWRELAEHAYELYKKIRDGV